MTNYELKASKRKLFGRKVKSLRRVGIVPGNVFGPNTKSVAIQLDEKTLSTLILQAGETSLVNLTIEGETKARPVLIAGYHKNPVSGGLLHVDLHEVNLKEKTTADVPLKFVGVSQAVVDGNVLVELRKELEVEALPTDLPDIVEVDISSLLAVGDSILAKDLKLDRPKVTLLVDADETIVTIQEPAKEEEPAPAEVAEGEEGEEGKEGDEKTEGEEKSKDKGEEKSEAVPDKEGKGKPENKPTPEDKKE